MLDMYMKASRYLSYRFFESIPSHSFLLSITGSLED